MFDRMRSECNISQYPQFSFLSRFITVDKYFPYPHQAINEIVFSGYRRGEMSRGKCCKQSARNVGKYAIWCRRLRPE